MCTRILTRALPILILQELLCLFRLPQQPDVDVKQVVGFRNALGKGVDLTSGTTKHAFEGFEDVVHPAKLCKLSSGLFGSFFGFERGRATGGGAGGRAGAGKSFTDVFVIDDVCVAGKGGR